LKQNYTLTKKKQRQTMTTDNVIQIQTPDVRQRTPPQAIEQVVRQIVTQFQPQKIILFGSYASGQPRPESDVDLLVVMDTPLKETEQAVRICQAIEYHFGLDLIVRTPAALARRLALGDPFLNEIIHTGKVMYECPDG
jgi:predicted nucleotidyltransferase